MGNFWEKTGWEGEDFHLEQLRIGPFRREFPKLDLKSGIYILRGPRQVGKTSWLKTLLSGELKRGRACYYRSCEDVYDSRDLSELLKSVRNYDLLLLDEISFVTDWARAVKSESDRGTLPTLIVTGSNAFDLRRGSERLPGRHKSGGELELLPMGFDEFVAMRKQARWPELTRLQELELYFRVGGFPSALIEAGPEGKTPSRMIDVLQKWIVGDIVRSGKQEIYLRELLGQLAVTVGSSISLQKLAQSTQIGSHHTAQGYVSVLEDCFALRTLYALDPNSGTLRFRKEKKFYFTDPLIYWLALAWSGRTTLDASAQLAEMTAAEALYRRFPRVGYYSSQKGEIDFYAHNQWALEVKWKDAAVGLSKAYLSLLVPQKIVWTKENFLSEWPLKGVGPK